MSSRPTSEEIKNKFIAIALIEEQIASVKEKFKVLYGLNENVVNETFLTENHHRWAEPSDDANDILFARLEESKGKLTEFYAKDYPEMQNSMDLVISSLQNIKAKL